MKITISKELSNEIQHKLMVVHDTEDLLEDYGVNQDEVYDLVLSLPREGGEWEIPQHLMKMVMEECRDTANVNFHMMVEALKDGDDDNAKVFGQIVAELDELFKN